MKISESKLRKIIRKVLKEQMAPPMGLEDDSQEFQRGYQDALDGAPKEHNANDEYDAGYEDGLHDAELTGDLGPGPSGYRLDKQRSGRY